MDYDVLKGILHVEAAHPSERLERHYLRRMIIYKNGAQEQELFFPRQKSAAGFVQDVELKAAGGELIAVEFFCSQGGTAKAEITVPEVAEGADVKDVPKKEESQNFSWD